MGAGRHSTKQYAFIIIITVIVIYIIGRRNPNMGLSLYIVIMPEKQNT